MTKLEKMGRAFALETLLLDYASHPHLDEFRRDLNIWVDDDKRDLQADCYRGSLQIRIGEKRHFFRIGEFEKFLDEFGFDEATTTFGTPELWETALEYFGIVAE